MKNHIHIVPSTVIGVSSSYCLGDVISSISGAIDVSALLHVIAKFINVMHAFNHRSAYLAGKLLCPPNHGPAVFDEVLW